MGNAWVILESRKKIPVALVAVHSQNSTETPVIFTLLELMMERAALLFAVIDLIVPPLMWNSVRFCA